MRARCRWRSLGLVLLALIVALNICIIFTLPEALKSEVFSADDVGNVQTRYDSHDDNHSRGLASHLQLPRRRLNKSNFTSDSFGTDGNGSLVGGRGGTLVAVVGDGAAWEEGEGGEHPSRNARPREDKFASTEEGNEEVAEDASSAERRSRLKETGGTGNSSWRDYTDSAVDTFVDMLWNKDMLDVLEDFEGSEQEDYWAFLKRQRLRRNKGVSLAAYKDYKPMTNWEKFHLGIHQHYLYDPDDPAIGDLLEDMVTKEVVDIEQKEGGTQLKLLVTFEDEGQALFKPMRFPRNTETLPDHFYFADFERHHAEIAAFHLDRVLGYNRVPPVAGRIFNITRDIHRHADSKFARTFFISPAGNLCFHGHCSYYCDSGHPICGHPDMLEASLMSFLPPEKMANRQTWRNPWKRSYSKHRKAYWEVYEDLCEKVRDRTPYDSGRRLLDIIDMSVLDFLMGNLDRHHYETFREFGNNTFLIHLDNGRGFGKSAVDEMSCLAPMMQCCSIRLSTLQRLVRLYRGPQRLSAVMRVALLRDAATPVLLQPHLDALDRRVAKVLRVIADCAGSRPIKEVVVDDGVY